MIDFSVVLLDLDGGPLHEGEIQVTLGRAASSALVQPYQDEQSLSGDDKVHRWQLAMKVRNAKEIDLPAEDIVLLKKCISKMYSPIVVGQVWPLLDPIQ